MRRYINSTQLRFLSVTIKGGLRFKEHVEIITTRANRRTNIKRCLAGERWGLDHETLRKPYIRYVRSVLEYVSAGWYSWISKIEKKKLQIVLI